MGLCMLNSDALFFTRPTTRIGRLASVLVRTSVRSFVHKWLGAHGQALRYARGTVVFWGLGQPRWCRRLRRHGVPDWISWRSASWSKVAFGFTTAACVLPPVGFLRHMRLGSCAALGVACMLHEP